MRADSGGWVSNTIAAYAAQASRWTPPVIILDLDRKELKDEVTSWATSGNNPAAANEPSAYVTAVAIRIS